ncbi:MAG: hypothetical protein P8182_04280 [Deltaproteobacteria bacterium]
MVEARERVQTMMAGIATRILLVLSLAVSVLIAVGMRFLGEDLFVALCAGRDVIAGNLAQPDSWSFTTAGAVWVNQGWLSHLIYYLSYASLGDLGPVLLKVMLLAACLVVLYFRCRGLGVSQEICLLSLTIGTLSAAPFLQIRAENFGLLYFVLLTGLLTAPRSWGQSRFVASALVVLLWANSHGSFVLGLALIGLKLLVQLLFHSGILSESAVPGREEERHRDGLNEVMAWGLTLVASVLLAGFVNPYGPANLLIPYRQLFAKSVTGLSADWLPLFQWRAFSEQFLFHPLDVRPFLLTLLLLAVLAVALLGTALIRRPSGPLFAWIEGRDKAELVMEILIPLVLVPACFKFRRIVLFAGISTVPLLALLIQSLVFAAAGSARREPGTGVRRGPQVVSLIASCAWFLVLASVLYRTTVVPYLPGNPTRPDRPLVSQLMSFDSFPMGIVRFMQKNGIEGRIFTSWVVSDFLLFHVPRVRVFMDCRDQSAYPDDVIRTFFSILSTRGRGQGAGDRAIRLLDRYGVSAVVLETKPRDIGLATLLMASRKWACVYMDGRLFLLVRTDDDRFEASLKAGRLPPLWYPDDRTRILSAAFLSYFMTGAIPPRTRDDLKRVLLERPDAESYGLIYLSGLGPEGCLNHSTRRYLLSEVRRLSKKAGTETPNGTKVIESLIRIVELLQRDQRLCSRGPPPIAYGELRKLLEKRLQRLKKTYLGYSL